MARDTRSIFAKFARLVGRDTPKPASAEPPAAAIEFAGFVLTHCAAIADANRAGELICPFAVLADRKGRRVVDFESDTQEEAVQKGWASLPDAQQRGDWWAFGREGIYRSEAGAIDVLTVTVWTPEMAQPFSVMQRFARADSQEFYLVGAPELLCHGTETAEEVASWDTHALQRGIESHPSGAKWGAWLRQ